MGGFFSVSSWNDVDTSVPSANKTKKDVAPTISSGSNPPAPPTPPIIPKGGRHGRTYKKRKNQRSKTRK